MPSGELSAECGALNVSTTLHCRRVYALCLRMAGNPTEAEDLTQEAFLTVLRKIRTSAANRPFSTCAPHHRKPGVDALPEEDPAEIIPEKSRRAGRR